MDENEIVIAGRKLQIVDTPSHVVAILAELPMVDAVDRVVLVHG